MFISGSKWETIVRCFSCHSSSVFKFDLLHCRKCTVTYVCMCFQISSAFLVRNISVWEIYLCWIISRSFLQSLTPLVLYTFIKRCYACSIEITYCRDVGVARGAKGAMFPKCLENKVILCFERRFSKKIVLSPKIKHFDPPRFLGWLRHCAGTRDR